MIKKLKSNSGETIAEVLVASLVVVLAVLLYTMMVQSSFRIITTSEKAMKEMYETESSIEAGEVAPTSTSAPVSFEITGVANPGISYPGDLNGVAVSLYTKSNIKSYTYVKH